ncbi:tubulin/FtsZ family protein [Haloprofundus marisrubri]|uniref:tubulin/FtsZ family protein n=1 Tax=Haloprofundus marisrubri TaxID=1514971 RepID=UPI0009E3E76E|nr:tubulin/FtsZ family protein [Haloprofundus marisrubri]
MKLIVIGVGQAGGRIADSLVAFERTQSSTFTVGAFAFDTTQQDLDALTAIPDQHRILYGQLEVSGQGVDGDSEQGSKLAEANCTELLRSLDDVPTSQADAILLTTSLGGGTGSTAVRPLTEELRQTYDVPIYGVGVLPATDQSPTAAQNSIQSLRTLTGVVDNLLLFDNEAWLTSGESIEDAFERVNAELVRRLGVLFSAGEVDASETVAESVIDASEIINTLHGGGVSVLGYSSTTVETTESNPGLLSRLLGRSEPEPVDATKAISVLETGFRKAIHQGLTAPCSLASTERALAVVGGPPAWLNRQGVERGRQYIESETECMEVRGGDYPQPDRESVEIDILFSGVSLDSRIDALQNAASKSEPVQELPESRR